MEPDEPIVTHDEMPAEQNLAEENFSDLPTETCADPSDAPPEFTSGVSSAEAIWDQPAANSSDEPGSVSDAPFSAGFASASDTAASGETAEDANDAGNSDVPPSATVSPETSEDYAGAGTGPTYDQAIAEINRIARSVSEEVSKAAADALPDTTGAADPYSAPEMTYEQALAEIDRFDQSLHTDEPETPSAPAEEPSRGARSGTTASANIANDEPPSVVDSDNSEPAEPARDEPVTEALSRADLNAMLASKAKDADEDLSWKTSVVDLLKLVGKDSSFEARERYAVELGFPEDKLEDTPSAELNMWLHKQLMTTLAENGGTLPSNLA